MIHYKPIPSTTKCDMCKQHLFQHDFNGNCFEYVKGSKPSYARVKGVAVHFHSQLKTWVILYNVHESLADLIEELYTEQLVKELIKEEQ